MPGMELEDSSALGTRITTVQRVAIDLTTEDSLGNGGESRPLTRAEAIVDLIIKSDRVFLDGACWKCTEHLPVTGNDLGLCHNCLIDLRDPA